jgi:hypothetical protein
MIFVAIGVVVVLDLTGAVPVWPSTYFAAALTTIALGLLVGTWFGRARWLIALGVLASLALGISATAESFSGVRPVGDVVWRPTDLSGVANRYETSVGDATLDLRAVDFSKEDAQITVQMGAGDLQVVLPPDVDVSTRVELDAGDARVFAEQWSGFDQRAREVTDLGTDGAGGGKLRLFLNLNVGSVEVNR